MVLLLAGDFGNTKWFMK